MGVFTKVKAKVIIQLGHVMKLNVHIHASYMYLYVCICLPIIFNDKIHHLVAPGGLSEIFKFL